LLPDVYGEKQLDSLTENMSDIEIQGQMQQNPYVGSNIFKPEWFDDRFTTVSNLNHVGNLGIQPHPLMIVLLIVPVLQGS
jgi:hypothetical protein